jgi:hypothetical protein
LKLPCTPLPPRIRRNVNHSTAMFCDVRGQWKCDGTRAETRFRLSAKRTNPIKSAGASVHSTTGSRGVRISGSRLHLKCNGTRGETRFRLLAKRTSPFKSAGASVQSTTGSRGVRISGSRLHLIWDVTRAETRFRLSAKRTSPFKSAGASAHSTTGSRGVRISGSNAGYTMFRGSVKSTGYPLHSPISPSLPLLCVTVCHHISTGVYGNH